jgi:alpha-D-xyloside xylohydrolase
VDGARVKALGEPYVDRKGFQTRLNLTFSDGEALYGLGQHEEGVLNHRGGHQFLYQHNLKVACRCSAPQGAGASCTILPPP